MKWAGNVALWGIRDIRTGFWWGNLKEEGCCVEICIAEG
jgi:hypothetical protein